MAASLDEFLLTVGRPPKKGCAWKRPCSASALILLLTTWSLWLGVGRQAAPELRANRDVPLHIADVGLRAPLVAASALTSLDGTDWLATSPSGLSIPARVPGEIVSDLYTAGEIGDPLFDLNFKRDAWLFEESWTFAKRTAARKELLHSVGSSSCGNVSLFLVFESIKMAADVRWNGRILLRSTSQFVRAIVSLPPSDDSGYSGEDEVAVSFLPSGLELTRGRYMACSGGWDWAPFSPTFEGPDHTFSRGLVGSAFLLAIPHSSLAISDVVTLIRYGAKGGKEAGRSDDMPVEPLEDGAHEGFTVEVRVFGFAGVGSGPVAGSLSVHGSWGAAASIRVQLDGSEIAPPGVLIGSLELSAPADAVRLWWPLGVGSQPLYTVSVSWAGADASACPHNRASAGGLASGSGVLAHGGGHRGGCAGAKAGVLCTSRRIGFRTVALATHGFPPPARPSSSLEGSGSVGMLLVVNGRPLVAKGANVIPPDEMEGRWSAAGLRALVRSAAAARMNCLRVWGGGAYLPPAFYEEADELGLLLLHDLMFSTTTQTHEPHGGPLEVAEVANAVRARSHHPSVAVWIGCNECDPIAQPLYVSHVLSTVAREDSSRPLWPASPSAGWASGVHPHSSLPNGLPLQARPLAPPAGGHAIEEHGPYLHGSGWPAVNQVPVAVGTNLPLLRLFDTRIPLPLARAASERAPIGGGANGSFVSEFGVSAMSSFESHAPTLSQEHWGVHGGGAPAVCTAPDRTTPFWLDCSGGGRGAVMSERNYPCDALLASYFALRGAQLDGSGEAAFRSQLFLCSLAQALALHAEVASQRARNTMGSLLWQLNEIWPTGGWGTLEYSASPARPSTAGQLLGGRWKPAHHWLRQHLFADVLATCGEGGVCFARTDALLPLNATVEVAVHALAARAVSRQGAQPVRAASIALALPEGPAVEWFSLPPDLLDGLRADSHFLTVTVLASAPAHRAPLSAHALLLVPPHKLAPLQRAHINASIGGGSVACDPEGYGQGRGLLPRWCTPVTLRASGTALFVTLSAAVDGHFSHNCLPLLAGEERVVFFASEELPDLRALRSSLRVDDLSAHYANLSLATT